MTTFWFTTKNRKTRKAFSLGEVLVAAFVLTVGLTATTALIVGSIGNAYDTRDAVIAAELAQEGVELVRNVRDQNFASEADGVPAGEGFAGFSETDKHCRMNADDTTLDCTASRGTPAGNGYYLSVPTSPANGERFAHTNTPSRFARYTYIEYNDTAKNARVVSYVFWDWGVASAMPSYLSNDGVTTSCAIDNKCIFSEAFLTRWNQ